MKFRIVFLCIFIIQSVAIAQNQSELSIKFIQTDASFKAPEYKIKHPDSASAAKELKEILYLLQNEGFLTAQLLSVQKDTTGKLQAIVGVGKKYRWAGIRPGNLDRNVLNRSFFRDKILYSEPIRHKSLVRLQKEILRKYENNGYPFASVSLDSVETDSIRMKAALYVVPGPEVFIDSLIVKGKVKLSPAYISTYLGIRPGDSYDESDIQRIRTRIRELPFVREDAAPQVEFYGNKAKVTLFLSARNANQFSGFIGFMPSGTQNSKLLLTGEVQAKLINLLGAGEQLQLEWRRLQVQTQSLQIYARYPFLFRTQLGIDGNFDLYRRDSTFQNIGYGFGIQYVMAGTDYLKLYYKRTVSKIIDRNQFSSATKLPDFADASVNQFGIAFLRERLNYRLNPLKGYTVSFNFNAGNKVITQLPELNPGLYQGITLNSMQFGLKAEAEYYVKLFRRMTCKIANQSAWIYNKNLFTNELHRLGGFKSLRGFNEESLFASAYSMQTIEFRYLIEQNSYVSLFWNGAWLERKIYTGYLRDLPYGFGAGLSFYTKAGIVGLSYAVGSQQGERIRFNNSKIHVGFVGLF